MNDVFSAISSLGFPIVICLIVMWYVKYMTDKFSAEIKSLRDSHKEESKESTLAIENNTKVLTILCERMNYILPKDDEKEVRKNECKE